MNFIDFKKAFDSVHRESLWKILTYYGIPSAFVDIFKNLYEQSACCVRTENGFTDSFNILTGVRQGCILSPLLFALTIDFVMKKATADTVDHLEWNDSKLTDLDFADDIAAISTSRPGLQILTTGIQGNGDKVGLRISVEKTKVMQVGEPDTPPITLDGNPLEDVKKFTYLGSIICHDGSSESDINARIGKGAGTFQKLTSIWKSKAISLNLKIKLFNSLVVPTVLYGSETWQITKKLSHKLDVFQQRCLRRILKITWRDRVRNDTILRRSNTRPLSAIITLRRMKLAGHILRLDDLRHAKTAMFWSPNGKRKRGRPKNTWRRTFKDDLIRARTTFTGIARQAADRQRWKALSARCIQECWRT